jgi:hypothetical protein
MTKLLITTALAATVVLAATRAHAGQTGNELLADYKPKSASELYCLGFVRGVADGMILWFAP